MRIGFSIKTNRAIFEECEEVVPVRQRLWRRLLNFIGVREEIVVLPNKEEAPPDKRAPCDDALAVIRRDNALPFAAVNVQPSLPTVIHSGTAFSQAVPARRISEKSIFIGFLIHNLVAIAGWVCGWSIGRADGETRSRNPCRHLGRRKRGITGHSQPRSQWSAKLEQDLAGRVITITMQ